MVVRAVDLQTSSEILSLLPVRSIYDLWRDVLGPTFGDACPYSAIKPSDRARFTLVKTIGLGRGHPKGAGPEAPPNDARRLRRAS